MIQMTMCQVREVGAAEARLQLVPTEQLEKKVRRLQGARLHRPEQFLLLGSAISCSTSGSQSCGVKLSFLGRRRGLGAWVRNSGKC